MRLLIGSAPRIGIVQSETAIRDDEIRFSPILLFARLWLGGR
ncbi:hypothetical protein J2T14_004761 [Paenibacillus harenae]|nr:hypothetical protein [Paenibacillus harenae]